MVWLPFWVIGGLCLFYVPTSIYIYICISSQENDHIFIDYENSGDIYDAYCINLYCIQTITRIVGILIDMMHTVYLLYMYIHNIYIVTHIYCTYIHIYIYTYNSSCLTTGLPLQRPKGPVRSVAILWGSRSLVFAGCLVGSSTEYLSKHGDIWWIICG